MKLLIASDLHGSAYYCEKLLARIDAERPDRILLLGDLLYHGPRNDLPRGYAPKEVIPMLNGLKERIIAVRGNCDAEVDQMVLEFPILADYTTILLENGRTLFATHGHLFDPGHLPPLPAGSAREVITRMLRYFSTEGLVKLGRGSLQVLDEERLTSIAGDSWR